MEDPDSDQVLNQALGMIAVQADCDIEAAAVLLLARAATGGQTRREIALQVVDRTTNFYRPDAR